MPFGIGTSRANRFSKKKTYTVQEPHVSPHKEDKGLVRAIKSSGPLSGHSANRRNTLPAGILKRGGSRPVSFPALEDGMVPSEMAAAIPMPTEAELNELFVEMVVGCCSPADRLLKQHMLASSL